MKKIVEIGSLREVIEYVDAKTHVFFDLDNTLLTSVHEFGSERWEHFFIQHFIQEGASEREAMDRATQLWKAVQTVSDIEYVEKDTADLVELLHTKGHPVLAITARAKEFRSVTEGQLKSLGLRFSHQGVFYCGDTSKGEVLKAYADLHQCGRIVLVDDLKRHLDSAALHLDIPFIGLRYGYLDARKNRYSPCEATRLLAKVFSDPIACAFLKKGLAL